MDKGCNYSRIEIALYNNINVYKIDRGKSVRVSSTGYCQFKKKFPASWVGYGQEYGLVSVFKCSL